MVRQYPWRKENNLWVEQLSSDLQLLKLMKKRYSNVMPKDFKQKLTDVSLYLSRYKINILSKKRGSKYE